jgi:hypothetical protein
MIKQTIIILAIVLAMTSTLFADEPGESRDLTPCSVLSTAMNNPICIGDKLEVAPSIEAVDILMNVLENSDEIIVDASVDDKIIIKNLENKIKDLLAKIAFLEETQPTTINKGVSILVPNPRYSGTENGNAKYCYPLETGIIGQYNWECE